MNTIRVLFDEGAVRAADLHDLLFAQGAAFLDLDYTEGVPAVDHACRVFGLDGFRCDVGELALGCRVVAAVARSSGADLAAAQFSGYWTRGDLDGASGEDLQTFADEFTAAFGPLHGAMLRRSLSL